MVYNVKISYPKHTEHTVSIKESKFDFLSAQRLDEHIVNMYPGKVRPMYTWSVCK